MTEIKRYRSRRAAINVVRTWGTGYGVEPINVRGLTWYRVVEYV
jgi:hypothetical protein